MKIRSPLKLQLNPIQRLSPVVTPHNRPIESNVGVTQPKFFRGVRIVINISNAEIFLLKNVNSQTPKLARVYDCCNKNTRICMLIVRSLFKTRSANQYVKCLREIPRRRDSRQFEQTFVRRRRPQRSISYGSKSNTIPDSVRVAVFH